MQLGLIGLALLICGIFVGYICRTVIAKRQKDRVAYKLGAIIGFILVLAGTILFLMS